jgi:hypothetical protein
MQPSLLAGIAQNLDIYIHINSALQLVRNQTLFSPLCRNTTI